VGPDSIELASPSSYQASSTTFQERKEDPTVNQTPLLMDKPQGSSHQSVAPEIQQERRDHKNFQVYL
jgi:hypothetical protein